MLYVWSFIHNAFVIYISIFLREKKHFPPTELPWNGTSPPPSKRKLSGTEARFFSVDAPQDYGKVRPPERPAPPELGKGALNSREIL